MSLYYCLINKTLNDQLTNVFMLIYFVHIKQLMPIAYPYTIFTRTCYVKKKTHMLEIFTNAMFLRKGEMLQNRRVGVKEN